MASDKDFKRKGFLLYTDDESFFQDLDNDEAGILIKSLFAYFNRGEMPEDMPKVIKMAFNVIRKSIDRDVSSYVEKTKKMSVKKKEWWDQQKQVSISNNNQLQVTKQTKTKSKTEAKTEVLDLDNGHHDPSPMERLGSDAGDSNGLFGKMTKAMLDDRDNDRPEKDTRRLKHEIEKKAGGY